MIYVPIHPFICWQTVRRGGIQGHKLMRAERQADQTHHLTLLWFLRDVAIIDKHVSHHTGFSDRPIEGVCECREAIHITTRVQRECAWHMSSNQPAVKKKKKEKKNSVSGHVHVLTYLSLGIFFCRKILWCTADSRPCSQCDCFCRCFFINKITQPCQRLDRGSIPYLLPFFLAILAAWFCGFIQINLLLEGLPLNLLHTVTTPSGWIGITLVIP